MNEITLSAKELLLLSSHLGANNFFGIQDPFRGMSKIEIRAEIPSIQLQAEQRGLATLGFDDTFDILPDVKRIISTCALCDKYITIDTIDCNIQSPREMLYSRNGRIVLLRCTEKTYKLQEISVAAVINVLTDRFFSKCTDSDLFQKKTTIRRIFLDKARTLEFEQAKQFLEEVGCPPEIAQVITMGLHGTSRYCSLIAVDVLKRAVDSFTCIISAQGVIHLSPSDAAGEEIWNAEWISQIQIKELLANMLNTFGGYAKEDIDANL